MGLTQDAFTRQGRSRRSVTFQSLKFLVLVTLRIHFCETSPILSIGDKCDNTLKSETHSSSPTKELDIINGTIFGYDPPVCDPSMPLECINGRCQCKRGFTISRNGTRCLEIARNGLDSPCEESIQCWKGLLGRLAECKKENGKGSGKCRCYTSDTIPIVYHQGRCYYGESLGEYCQIDGLCEATVPNADCRTTCQCRDGYLASWDKSRCLQIAVNGLNSSCEENVQCEKSTLGALSQCDQETMTCQCYQIPNMPSVYYAGKCYFGSALSDVCQVDAQCISKTRYSTCSKDGKCQCMEGYIANNNNTLCLQIPSADGSSSIGFSECIEDIQCMKVLGFFSRCNSVTRRCECYTSRENTSFPPLTSTTQVIEAEEPVTAMVIIGSKCQTAKFLGQPCKFNKQCSATTANAVCYNGVCECREETHVRSIDGRKCLEVAKNGLDSDCDEHLQCIRSSLGPLSICSDKKKCECSNILPVVYYDKKCYFHRQLGSPCESGIECIAGGNFLSECVFGRCGCRNGTEPFTDHSCIHSSNASISLNLKRNTFFIASLASLIAILFILSSPFSSNV